MRGTTSTSPEEAGLGQTITGNGVTTRLPVNSSAIFQSMSHPTIRNTMEARETTIISMVKKKEPEERGEDEEDQAVVAGRPGAKASKTKDGRGLVATGVSRMKAPLPL